MSDICRKVYWRHSLSILVFIFILAWPVVPLAKAQSATLDLSAYPEAGNYQVAQPYKRLEFSLVGGGPVDVGYLGQQDCVGHTHSQPDFRVQWIGYDDGEFTPLSFIFRAEGNWDPTLIINDPNNSWRCNDDWNYPDSYNPMVEIGAASHGQYDIWVGNTNDGELGSGTLIITDVEGTNPEAYDRRMSQLESSSSGTRGSSGGRGFNQPLSNDENNKSFIPSSSSGR